MGEWLRRVATDLLLAPWLDAMERDAVRADLEELSRISGSTRRRLGPTGYFWLALVKFPFHLARAETFRPFHLGSALLAAAEPVRQEFRLASRRLLRRPTHALVTVATLATAMAMASVTLLTLRALNEGPLPFPDADDLVVVHRAGSDPTGSEVTMLASVEDLAAIRNGVPALASVAGMASEVVSLQGEALSRPGKVTIVTDGFFSLLGVEVVLGRPLSSGTETPAVDREVLLSHDLWTHLTAEGSPGTVLGSWMELDGVPHRIVGVLPPQMRMPYGSDAWIPWRPDDAGAAGSHLSVMARVGPGVSLEAAMAQIGEIPGIEGLFDGFRAMPMRSFILSQHPMRFRLAFLGALLLLSVGVVNIASLAVARLQEDRGSVRLMKALGAAPTRLVIRYGAEVAIMVSTAMAMALGIGPRLAKSVAALVSLEDIGTGPVGQATSGDLLLATVSLGVLTGLALSLAIGLWYGVEARRSRGGRPHRSTPDREPRLTGGLIALQVTVVVLLLAGVAALGEAARPDWRPGLGVESERVLSLRGSVAAHGSAREQDRATVVARAERRLAALPGVRAAAVTTANPFRSEVVLVRYVSGETNTPVLANRRAVGRDYFRVLGLELVEGRDFNEGEAERASDAAIITRALARQLWPGEEAVGRKLRWGLDPATAVSLTVVGVTTDVAAVGDIEGSVFRPFVSDPAPADMTSLDFLILHDASPAAMAAQAVEALQEVAPTLAVDDGTSLADLISFTHRLDAFGFVALLGFTLLALVLALGGIHGSVSSVLQRNARHLAIRRVLGAGAPGLLPLVFGRLACWTASGVALGFVGVVLARGPGEELLAIPSATLQVPGTILLALGVAGMAVVAVPFLHAMRSDPREALAEE